MDKSQAIEIAEKYINLLKTEYDIQNAMLFGSFAKGTNHKDSDIDIAIVLRHVNDIIDTQIEFMKRRREIDLRIEPHPFNEIDFNRTDPIVDEILKHGVAINVA